MRDVSCHKKKAIFLESYIIIPMESFNMQQKRRVVYIDKSFQFNFIVKFVLILVLGGLISIGLTLMTTRETVTTSFMNSRLVIENTSWAIMPSVILTTLITTAVVGVVVVLVTLFFSHKIAGPMYRFDKDIKRIAAGDLKSKIFLRQGDQLTKIATSLNEMIDALNTKVSAVEKALEELHDTGEAEGVPEAFLKKIETVHQSFEREFTL